MRWFYIDGYAGSGHHVSRERGDLIEGSPLIALNTKPARTFLRTAKIATLCY
jgi:hypothetical protein